ncbi:MAG: helix-turn-helix transcriptional regulator [Oscillochloris sp.]|nr:helix-turn-helix transcriptional regulator [Oscillochloris sp.]
MSDHVHSERRERKDVQRNLERVLQAARELFAERGSDVKMEEVARRAGVGVGTIYRRFAGKSSCSLR